MHKIKKDNSKISASAWAEGVGEEENFTVIKVRSRKIVASLVILLSIIFGLVFMAGEEVWVNVNHFAENFGMISYKCPVDFI